MPTAERNGAVNAVLTLDAGTGRSPVQWIQEEGKNEKVESKYI
jgi:hypothetical protein